MDSKFQQLSVSTNSALPIEDRWEKVVIPGPLPARRSYHTAVNTGHSIIIFGGEDLNDGIQSDAWQLHLKDQINQEDAWEHLCTTGTSPGRLSRHASAVLDNCMYVIGGTDGVSDNTSVYGLNLRSLHWSISQSISPPIDSHTAVVDMNSRCVLVFGGYLSTKLSNQMHRLFPASMKWETWMPLDGPSARASHTSIVHENSMYVFGGLGKNSKRLNDMWKYDLSTDTWTEIKVTGDIPEPVSGHSACHFEGKMYIFGGLRNIFCESNSMYYIDLEMLDWVRIQQDLVIEDPVSAVQLEEFESYVKATSPTRTKRSRHLYEGPPQKTKGRVRGKAPQSRDGHTAVVFDSAMYVFGGDRHHMPYNDVYCYYYV